MEKILSIKEEDRDDMCGYVVTTTVGEIIVMIDDGQLCCEDWGYVSTPDDVSEFVGAELLKVEVVDDALNKKLLDDVYDACAIFVNFETSNGLFQLTIYNGHNGYYSHDVLVKRGESVLEDGSL